MTGRNEVVPYRYLQVTAPDWPSAVTTLGVGTAAF
jgi:hypothetical protein